MTPNEIIDIYVGLLFLGAVIGAMHIKELLSDD
jgi:hypothetical protein